MVGGAIIVMSRGQQCASESCGYVMLSALIILSLLILWILREVYRHYKKQQSVPNMGVPHRKAEASSQ